jgi:hypothetical protein
MSSWSSMFYLCYLFYLHILLSNMYILLDIHGQFMFAILQDYSVYSVCMSYYVIQLPNLFSQPGPGALEA